ncbi:DNA primase [Methanocalculus sp. MC3]
MKNQILEDACQYFERYLTEEHRNFLQSRYGFSRETITKYRIGYAPPKVSGLLEYLMSRGYPNEDISTSGLINQIRTETKHSSSDLFQGRLVFPYLLYGSPLYFIARETDATPSWGDYKSPKYIKQKVLENGFIEPIFGADTVIPSNTLVITEGITDCIAVHQAGYPAISPVTTRFKEERMPDVIKYCKFASEIIIINDSEESGIGTRGAAKIAMGLITGNSPPTRIGEIPRPDGEEKVDLNDYLRAGGSLASLIESAIPAQDHPSVHELQNKMINRAMTTLRSERSSTSRIAYSQDDIEALKDAMPSLSAYTGIAPGHRGSHPVYGSIHGDNFAISQDGQTWTSFHGGAEKGRAGDILKLIALEQGFLDDENDKLRGDAFNETVKFCRKKYGVK